MKRINRREEQYQKTGTGGRPTGNWMHRVWITTELRANAWSKKHNNRSMGAIQWNALWERTRDEIYGESWACERQHGYAREAVCK